MTIDLPLPTGEPLPTPTHRRRRSRRRQRGRRLRRAGFVGALLLALSALAWSVPTGEPGSGDEMSPVVAAPGRAADVQLPTSTTKPVRRVRYRYSIVSGGVLDAAEFAQVREFDPVVAAHYRDIDAAHLRLSRIEASRAVHVSYRVNDRIYWTGRKVWLQKGELLLTDGVNEVRARCGNRIAERPAGEVLPTGPPPEVLDQVEPDPVGLDPLEAFPLLFPDTLAAALDDTMPLPPPDIPLPATPVAFIAPVGDLVVPRPNVVPPGPVPEPATWMLVGVGSALGVLRRWRTHRAARDSRLTRT